MKKLENIPKTNIFEAPEGYFDRLPGIIQARVAEKAAQPAGLAWSSLGLRYALPVLLVALGSWFFLRQPSGQSAEDILASIDSTQLIAYLEDSDVTSEDLLENISLDDEDADEIENSSMEEIQLNAEDAEILSDQLEIEF